MSAGESSLSQVSEDSLWHAEPVLREVPVPSLAVLTNPTVKLERVTLEQEPIPGKRMYGNRMSSGLTTMAHNSGPVLTVSRNLKDLLWAPVKLDRLPVRLSLPSSPLTVTWLWSTMRSTVLVS